MSDKYIFLAPRLSNEHVMCSKRSEENEPRRLERFLYIHYWAGVTPLLGVKPQLALNQKYNLLTISILKTAMSSFNHKGSHTMKMNRYKVFGQKTKQVKPVSK